MLSKGYRSSTLSLFPSWRTLEHLRCRGQKPAACLIVTDEKHQQYNLVQSGAFALPLPQGRDFCLVSGLDVVLIAWFSEKLVDVASRVMGANPRYFATYFRGRQLSVVIG